MKLFRVLVLVIALVAGGVAAYLAINLSPSGGPAPTVVELAPQIQSQDVLVAATDIVQGAKIAPDNVRWQRWPDDAMNGNYIQKQTRPDAIQQLQNSVVRNSFVAGEPIREVKLARPGSGFLSAILPPGKRAIAVRISANNTAGGFILPGDRVDVVETVAQQGSADGPTTNVSRTLLTNVKVLAIDQSVQDKEGEPVVVGKTATLELDPPQVELVTAAEASGTLSLSLRSIADTDEVVSAREQKQSGTVRIFRGGRSQVLTTQQ
jgi:pilus assembly protein CpaB